MVISTHEAGPGGELVDALRAAEVPVEEVGPVTGPLRMHPGLAPAMRSAVAAADVVHIHGLWESVQYEASREAEIQGKPYILRPCGMLDPWSLSQGRIKKRLYRAWRLDRMIRRAALMHYTSAEEQRLAEATTGRRPAIVVPNGIELAEFQAAGRTGAFRAAHLQGFAGRIILFLGRIHHKKGLDLLIPAFARARLDNTLLVIIGPGEEEQLRELRALSASHRIDGQVRVLPMLRGAERVAALADADVFALTSRQENFGIAVVEALAAGLPVIVSDQVNIADQISAAGVGVSVPLEVDAIAAALRAVVGAEAPAGFSAERARAFVAAHYDWEAIAARWSTVYTDLAERP